MKIEIDRFGAVRSSEGRRSVTRLSRLLLRLKVANHKINEIEMLVHRNADDATALEKFGQPNPAWTQPLEPAQRVPRKEMIKIANSYFDGILHSSGDTVPFDPKCNRILDGDHDTNNRAAKGGFDKDSFRPDAMGFEEVRKANGNSGLPDTITHLQFVRPEDIPRFHELGVIASFQLFWASAETDTIELVKPYIDPALYEWQYPARSILDSGSVIADASD